MSAVLELMARQLHELGVREHGVLLVHSSLRSLGHVEGGPETVIRALVKALGDGGTLLFPALSYETVNSRNPHFDVRNTPSCVGALPEYFRLREGTKRSLHPTHSVCGVGAQVDDLLQGHRNDSTPCGENSPFHKLPHHGGQILFIGCGLRPNTSMHAIEERATPPYLYGDVLDYSITDDDGRVSTMRVRRHNFRNWTQRYDRVAQVLDSDALRAGKVLEAECHLIEAAPLWVAVREKLKEDPVFFVDWHEAQRA
ncbi:MAG: AAC(3) family N-acetyltransferase [Chloroflexi bacterium]|nr:AAC(3) family N-acetyltransferase [Chloroflexota bacterium]